MDLREAIETIERGDWVSLRFITADLKQGTGGKVLELAKTRIARNRQSMAISSPSPILSSELVEASKERGDGVEFKRPPNHALNFTRNMELPNKQLRKIHPILLTHVNQQAVI